MQVLFVLRFYHPDKADEIDYLIYASADLCMKLFRVSAGNIHSFRIRFEENGSDHISKLV